MHESFERGNDIKASTERSFGIVFAIVFAVVAIWPLLDGASVRLWAAAVAGFFLAAAFLFTAVLRPLNLLWFKFGMVLHKAVTPIVMALLFYLTIVPTGLIMRMVGKDPLHRRFEPGLKSYWVNRVPPGPEPDSMKNQF